MRCAKKITVPYRSSCKGRNASASHISNTAIHVVKTYCSPLCTFPPILLGAKLSFVDFQERQDVPRAKSTGGRGENSEYLILI